MEVSLETVDARGKSTSRCGPSGHLKSAGFDRSEIAHSTVTTKCFEKGCGRTRMPYVAVYGSHSHDNVTIEQLRHRALKRAGGGRRPGRDWSIRQPRARVSSRLRRVDASMTRSSVFNSDLDELTTRTCLRDPHTTGSRPPTVSLRYSNMPHTTAPHRCPALSRVPHRHANKRRVYMAI